MTDAAHVDPAALGRPLEPIERPRLSTDDPPFAGAEHLHGRDQTVDIPKLSERLMGMSDATWARHANPWSGWTRITVLPLLCVAVWSRVWLGWHALWLVLAVLIWTWANPRLFGPPTNHLAWMTRGVLGERVWLASGSTPIPPHHARVARILNLVAGLGLFVLAYGLWTLRLGWTMAGLVTTVGAKLWFLDRMVWLLADTPGNSGNPKPDHSARRQRQE